MNMSRLIVLLLSAALASEAGVSGQAPAAATTLRVYGTIAKYDAPSRTLSLSTSAGEMRLPLAPTTRIRQSGHTVDALALQKATGDHATVRYTESDGHRLVESVHLFGK
jgi:hypothetical protein